MIGHVISCLKQKGVALTLWHLLHTCCQRFLSSFFRIGFTKKSTAPLDRHLKTIPIESWDDITANKARQRGNSMCQISKERWENESYISMKMETVKWYLLITGIFLKVLWLMILHKRPIPDIKGMTTSVRTRSIWLVRSAKIFHAWSPFATAITAKIRLKVKLYERKKIVTW